MKKIIYCIFPILLTTAILTSYGCSTDEPDNCENIDCGSGECINGSCICPDNFTGENCENCIEGMEGENCDIEIREKFFGTYDITAGLCFGGIELDLSQAIVDSNSTGLYNIILTLSDGFQSITLDGQISGDTLRADGYISGEHIVEGILQSDGSLAGTYRYIFASFEVDGTCEVTFNPQ